VARPTSNAGPLSGGRIADRLATARARLDRVAPEALDAAMADGALVVDLRPAEFRTVYGALPGAVVVERIHLEWRLDPTSPDRLPQVEPDQQVILVCNEGYASSLAAADLLDLGVARATDVIGGYQAWAAIRARGEAVLSRS
jgi:rhodanese-related sulfurtransferase